MKRWILVVAILWAVSLTLSVALVLKHAQPAYIAAAVACLSIALVAFSKLMRAHQERVRQTEKPSGVPVGLSPCRSVPAPDPCRAEYGSFDRILLFGPVILFMVFGSLFLFISLADLPYGIQLASIISYTTAVFLITFSAQKGQQRYLFTCPVVRSQLSRLAQRHIGFLAILFVLQTAALSLRPRMPASWFVASVRNMSPFTLALVILCMGLGFTEILTNRSLLKHAHLEQPLT